MTFLQEIIDEIPRVEIDKEENDKLEDVPKNISKVPNPGKEVILSKQRSRFS